MAEGLDPVDHAQEQEDAGEEVDAETRLLAVGHLPRPQAQQEDQGGSQDRRVLRDRKTCACNI